MCLSVVCVCVCVYVCVCVCDSAPPPLAEVCEAYSLRFCSSLPGYADRTVYIDKEEWSLLTMEDIESNMLGLYHSLEGHELTPGCQNALRHIICHGSLPFCKSEGECVNECVRV